MKKKSVALLLAATLAVGGVIGGSLAWLADDTEAVVNTFTTSDIEVTLAETTSDFQMVPGHTISKDPKVTVTATSEACYLFVKVDESTNLDDYIKYEIDSAWTALESVDGVYYMEIEDESKKGVPYSILGSGSATFEDVNYSWTIDEVLVKPTVTKTMMEDLTTNKPTLTFTAYAVQLYKNNTEKFTPAEAWALAQTLD